MIVIKKGPRTPPVQVAISRLRRIGVANVFADGKVLTVRCWRTDEIPDSFLPLSPAVACFGSARVSQ